MKGWIQSNVRFGPVSDVQVCNHDERYSIEVQVRSLFEDQTVSWVRVVNGLGKFAREAMPTQEEEIASVKPHCKQRDPDQSRQQWRIQTLFLLEKENGLTSKHRDQTIISVFKCRRLLLDYYDTVKKFLEELMEPSFMTMLLKNAGKNSAMLRSGQLINGYKFLQKRKGFNIA